MENNIELNNCLPLGLEKINTPVKNICILGNTAGMFGKFPGNENNWNDENFVNCITFIVNNINENFFIIGDEFVFEYYNTMFCWLKQMNIIQKKVAVNTIDINNKKYKGDYIECLKDINKSNMKFDVVIMNPPYDDPVGGKGSMLYANIIENCISFVSKKLIAISPAGAFISKSAKPKSFKEKIDIYKPTLYVTKEWENFTAHPQSLCCISEWNVECPNSKIIVNNKEFSERKDITIINNEYLDKFYSKLCQYISNNGSLYDISVANPKNSQYFDPNGRNKIVEKWKNHSTYFTVLPYCIASHSTTYGYEKYSDKLWNGPARLLIPYNTENEAKNCFESIQSVNENAGVLTPFYKLIAKVLVDALFISSAERYKYFPIVDYSKKYSTKEMFNIIEMEYDENKINELIECLSF